MPHAEIKYTQELALDTMAILAEIEQIILRHDPASGACKGRAYPCSESHHPHFHLNILMLEKPHRDASFTAGLMKDVEEAVKAHIHQSCYFSFGLDYSGAFYVTNEHRVPD